MENRVGKFIGNICSKVKGYWVSSDMEDISTDLGRVGGALVPSAVAFSISPKLGICTAVPAMAAAVATEIDYHCDWFDGWRVKSAVRAGFPVAVMTGAALGVFDAPADWNSAVAIGVGAGCGVIAATASGVCSMVGHYAGRVIGSAVEVVRDLVR